MLKAALKVLMKVDSWVAEMVAKLAALKVLRKVEWLVASKDGKMVATMDEN